MSLIIPKAITRRRVLVGISSALICAPAIVRAQNIIGNGVYGDVKVGGGGTLLLDPGILSATATYAYSLRKLRTAYAGFAVNVVSSGAGGPFDIGFSGNDFDSATLATDIGANTGTINTWYNQIAGGTNASQGVAASRPRIRNAGTTDVIAPNNVPCIRFITGGSGTLLQMPSANTNAQPWSLAVCFRQNTIVSGGHLTDGGAQRLLAGFTATPNYQIYAGTAAANGGTPNTTQTHSGFFIFNTTTSNVFIDGTNVIINQSIGTNTMSTGEIIGNGQGGPGFDGWIAEVIWFNSVLSAGDQSTIRTSWQTYYGSV